MKNSRGYTIIEMMVAMAVFAIVITGIYETYHYQQKSYVKQEKVTDIQRNLRAGFYFLKRDIKMAGFDPNPYPTGATITIANIAELEFEADNDGTGTIGDGPLEIIRYTLTNDGNDLRNDPTRDGVADDFPCGLAVEYNQDGWLQPVAESVEALEFCYVLTDGTITTQPLAVELNSIRAVFVSMLVRSEQPLTKIGFYKSHIQASNDRNLVPDDKWWGDDGDRPNEWYSDDKHGRRLLIAKIRCRNMGTDPYAD
jgi:type IV pilus assembly protein PilW